MADDAVDGPLPQKAFPDGEFKPEELKAVGQVNALTNQEARILLLRAEDAERRASANYSAPPLMRRALDYLARLEPRTEMNHADTVGHVREVVLSRHRVYEYEMALLVNLQPESADEALALVPSLRERYDDTNKAQLQSLLDELEQLKGQQ